MLVPAEAGPAGYRTVALSAATGDEAWRTNGEPHTVSGDAALMADYTTGGGLRQLRLIRLADNGTAWLVVARNLGADSLQEWITALGYEAHRHASGKGYRVLRVNQHNH